MPKQDTQIVCKDCSQTFIWTVAEQEKFEELGLKNTPKRCRRCRKENRERRGQEQPRREDFEQPWREK